jgi:hypothetical protein
MGGKRNDGRDNVSVCSCDYIYLVGISSIILLRLSPVLGGLWQGE